MSDPISGVAGKAVSHHMGEALKQKQQQPGGGSFESMLHQAGQKQNATEGAQSVGGAQTPQGPEAVSSQITEQARLDLLQRVGSLPPGTPNIAALLPEFFQAKTQSNWIKEALSTMGNSPKATDLRGAFGQVEKEWAQLDTVMRSGKDMSQADLLVLQGRLYQLTQHVEVLSKVVDQVTGGVKTILNTNV